MTRSYDSYANIADNVLRVTYNREEPLGIENIPTDGPALIASNHRFLADPFVFGIDVLKHTGRRMTFAAKKEYADGDGLGRGVLGGPIQRLFTDLDLAPVDRGSARGLAPLIEALRPKVESGLLQAIFPEGSRSKKDGRLFKLYTGAAHIAKEFEEPIIPTTLTYQRARFGMGRTTVRSAFGVPISQDQVSDLSVSQLTDLLKDRLLGLGGQEYAGVHNPRSKGH